MKTILCLFCLLLPSLVTSASVLEFDRLARPASLVLGTQEMLNSGSSAGFHLRYLDGDKVTDTALSQITYLGNQITVSHPDGGPSFTFEIDTYPNHVAIHLLDAQGIGSGHGYRLSLSFNSTDIAAYTLNDLMTDNSGNRRRKNTELSWPYLWAWPHSSGTFGSVVLYDASLEGDALDAVLAEIWSTQSLAGYMVRPAGQVTWTEADVMAWVKRWVAKFEKMVVVSISPENAEELYNMTEKLVIPSGANRVYLFSTDWRGEYTLRKLANESVAGDAFPRGKEDLLRYSSYLAQHGVHLQLKSLVPQMGHEDARYFSETHCETRLLSWGAGSLVDAIDRDVTTIRFKPGEGYVWPKESGYLRIGDELIRANHIASDAADGVWTFSECERGKFATTAKSHRAGADIVGVSHSYGYVHFADDFGQVNSLAEEVLNPYGDFLNEANVGHLHFDGTGHHDEAPWYLRNYTDYVYSRVDQPVTGSRVGGSLKANFEKMFSIAEQAKEATGYWGIRIGPRLHGMGRGAQKEERNFAPNLLDMHFDIADRILLGGRRPNFTGGRSGGILSMKILEEYGLIDEALQLFRDWIELAPIYDDADVAYVASKMKKRKGSNHYEGEDVLVLSKDEQGRYIYTPHRVMGRTSGEDRLIQIDQEWGAIPRYQIIQSGARMELFNPYEPQEPQVVIYVEESSPAMTDPLIQVAGGALAVQGEVQAGEYMRFNGGNAAQVYDHNWNLRRTLPARAQSFTIEAGKNQVKVGSANGSERPEIKVQLITLGPVYVLETNKHRAKW